MSQKITKKQKIAAQLIAYGESIGYAASKVEVRRETMSRWKKRPLFIKEVEKVMEEQRQNLKQRFDRVAESAVEMLLRQLHYNDPDPKCIQTALDVIKIFGTGPFMHPDVAKTRTSEPAKAGSPQ